jgi:hypothetical protein
MRIIQMFTKQHPKTTLGTILRTVQGMITNEATARCKEQVSVRTSQARKRIKSYAVDEYEDRGGKARLWIELNPMCTVIIRHERLH